MAPPVERFGGTYTNFDLECQSLGRAGRPVASDRQKGARNICETWTADNPKASLMKRKRAAIVDAARCAFLENGYASTPMDRIAAAAGVSIKRSSFPESQMLKTHMLKTHTPTCENPVVWGLRTITD
jgi:hypothetical protein